jgi:hypothetical protein
VLLAHLSSLGRIEDRSRADLHRRLAVELEHEQAVQQHAYLGLGDGHLAQRRPGRQAVLAVAARDKDGVGQGPFRRAPDVRHRYRLGHASPRVVLPLGPAQPALVVDECALVRQVPLGVVQVVAREAARAGKLGSR